MTPKLTSYRDNNSFLATQQAEGFERLDGSQKEIIRLLQAKQTPFNDELKIQNEVFAKFHHDNKQHVTAEHERTRVEIVKALKESKTVDDTFHRNAAVTNDTATHDVEMQRTQIEDAILDSLRFPYMKSRYDGIEDAYKRTFNWIYEPMHSETKPWDNFADWLTYGEGIYWINGKAGSGKSTLMRYIYEDGRTLSLLEEWAGSSAELITAGFFFWKSGVPEQSSQVGLLRSLLYTLLSKRRQAIALVFAVEWNQMERRMQTGSQDWSSQYRNVIWSPKKLEQSLEILFDLLVDTRVCLFIDGLDEYNGDPTDNTRLFKHIASPNIKICLSSRPWVEFHEAFDGLPRLRLQDLTFDDIRLYVNETLAGDERMVALAKENQIEASTFVTEIVTKADGVFLWVRLVVRSLLEGITYGDSIDELRSRLAELPSDLAQLYAYMFDAIKPKYRVEGSKCFQMMRAWQNLSILPAFGTIRLYICALVLYFALEENSGTVLDAYPLALTWTEMTRLIDRIDKRLKVCCAGLLELVGWDVHKTDLDDEKKAHIPGVQYIHRTASDFLVGEQASSKITEITFNISFGAYGALLRGFTLQLKTCPYKLIGDDFDSELWIETPLSLVGTPLSLAYYAEKEKVPPTVEAIDATLQVLSSLIPTCRDISKYGYSFLEEKWPQDTLILAIRASLLFYLSAKFAQPARVPRPPCGKSYLYHAISKGNIDSRPLISSECVIAFLLPHSSSTDIEEGWEMALMATENRIYCQCRGGLVADDEFKMWLGILKLFLKCGANPTTEVKLSRSPANWRSWRDGTTCSVTDMVTELSKFCPVEAAEVQALLTKGRIWRHRLGFSKIDASKARSKLDWTQYPERTWWKRDAIID